MWERFESIVTANGWIICAKCGHKLARIAEKGSGVSTNTSEPKTGRTTQTIEFKCQSCKTLNTYTGGGQVINE